MDVEFIPSEPGIKKLLITVKDEDDDFEFLYYLKDCVEKKGSVTFKFKKKETYDM